MIMREHTSSPTAMVQQQGNSSNTTTEFLTASSLVVDKPLADDILCGKDKKCMTHEGSLFFKSVIDAHTVEYREAASRNGKMAVTKKVFDMLQSKRFLKLNEDTKQWEVLHPLSIRDKIGHALRFANRKNKSAIAKAKSKNMIRPRRTDSSSSASSLASDSSSHSCSTAASAPSLEDLPPLRMPGSPVCVTQVESMMPELCVSTGAGAATDALKMQPTASASDERDLWWILKLPIMEENPFDKKIYFVNNDTTPSPVLSS